MTNSIKTQILNSTALESVLAEREQQEEKWGQQNHDPFIYLTILGEEYGELCQTVLHAKFGGHTKNSMREEAVQVAAVALAIVECLDRNKWQWPLYKTNEIELRKVAERVVEIFGPRQASVKNGHTFELLLRRAEAALIEE